MDFITIDFETAASDRSSACEIGLTFVEKNKIVETKSWLIQPPGNYYDYFNILIHGIEPEETKDAPNFGELWEEIKPLIEGKFLIAHNAGFDISVLRHILEFYDIPFPNLQYSCSYIFSKKVWQGLPAYDLATLCDHNNIELQHHRAGPDSKATAELALKAFKNSEVTSTGDFFDKLRVTIGELFEDGYKASRTRRVRTDNLIKLEGDPEKHQPDNIFYDMTVGFTGKMESMTRVEAGQLILDIGGNLSNGVTQKTNYLVVGHQDYRVVGQDGMSRSQKKALDLINKGFEIEVLSEIDFIRNLEE